MEHDIMGPTKPQNLNFFWRTPKFLVRLKNAKQRNCLELGAHSQLSALEGVEGRAEALGLD
jgi:hypothetical protein